MRLLCSILALICYLGCTDSQDVQNGHEPITSPTKDSTLRSVQATKDSLINYQAFIEGRKLHWFIADCGEVENSIDGARSLLPTIVREYHLDHNHDIDTIVVVLQSEEEGGMVKREFRFTR